MKKSIITLIIFAFFAFFASCGKRNNNTEQPTDNTFDYGVVINGIRWATRNVDAPGTFAPTPESAGMFFQWNRRKGWNITGRRVRDWNNADTAGTTWYAKNDPCPDGWRVPTEDELRSLRNAGSVWTEKNGIQGRIFGTAPYQIFLPGGGNRHWDTGTRRIGLWGDYWSSTPIFANGAYVLNLFGGSANMFISSRAYGLFVRCVAINETPTETTDFYDPHPPPPTLLIKDIDNDGISDTIRIHYFLHPRHKRFATAENVQVCDSIDDEFTDGFYRVVVRLSSRGFEKMQSANRSFRLLGAAVVEQGIFSTDNGFEFYESVARGGFHESRYRFRYDVQTGRMRLVELVQSSTPGRFYDGTASLNLLTGEFVGDWYIRRPHQDYEEDRLYRMPTTRTTMNVGKLFLEDLGTDVISDVRSEISRFGFDARSEFINEYLGGN